MELICRVKNEETGEEVTKVIDIPEGYEIRKINIQLTN